MLFRFETFSLEASMSFWDYYGGATSRAFWHGWGWAEGQGIWLTLWFAAAIVVLALLRLRWRQTRFRDVMREWFSVAKESCIAVVGGTLILVLGLFVWSFIQDAPAVVGALQQERDTSDHLLKAAEASNVQLTNTVKALQSQMATVRRF